tara:strand:+ start:51 stop:806 length:756 start_codon:yes stop_codon:yes gene_type:complete
MTQRYNFGEAFSYFDMPQEFAQTASFRSQNNPAVYTPGGIMNPELLQKLARGQAPAEESRGIIDILKSGAAGARDIFLQGAGATGGLNIGARTGMMFGPEFALPFGIAGAVLGSKFTEMGPSGSFYEGLTEDQQAAVDEIYGDKGIMAGYNPVSRFGRGAAGAIDKRIGNIMETLRKQELEGKVSDVLQTRLDKLQADRDRITGTIRDAAGNITGGTGQGTIDSGNEGGYGGTGGEGPSAVGSSGMLGGGV